MSQEIKKENNVKLASEVPEKYLRPEYCCKPFEIHDQTNENLLICKTNMNTMETPDLFNHRAKAPLQNLINRLIQTLLPVTTSNNISIVNDVSPELSISADEDKLASVINGLLYSIINNAWESCIRITAKVMYGNTVVVSVKDSNSYNTYAVACSLQEVVPLAARMGGHLDITNQRQKITTIAFRFPITQEEQEQGCLQETNRNERLGLPPYSSVAA